MRTFKEISFDIGCYTIIVFIVLVIVMYFMIIQIVVGDIMSPTFFKNDVLLINKLQYRFFKVKRYDIVSIYKDEEYYINRIIGMPNESIAYKDNILYINNIGYKENKFADIFISDFSITDLGYKIIPENMYLVVGDNRSDLFVRLVSKNDIKGRVISRIWPLNSIKMY